MFKHVFIPYIENKNILIGTIDSLIDQVDKITVINNSLKNLDMKHPKITFFYPADTLCFEQSLNFAIRCSDKEGNLCLWAHSDIIASPGAVDALYDTYYTVDKERWGVVFSNYDSLCLFNPLMFTRYNLWGDVNIFPGYFGDNLRYYRMDLLNILKFNSDKAAALVQHLGSQTIRNSEVMNMKNNLTFGHYAQMYQQITGGPPGHETNRDPTLGGLFPYPP